MLSGLWVWAEILQDLERGFRVWCLGLGLGFR